jgi:hypothetical protein
LLDLSLRRLGSGCRHDSPASANLQIVSVAAEKVEGFSACHDYDYCYVNHTIKFGQINISFTIELRDAPSKWMEYRLEGLGDYV